MLMLITFALTLFLSATLLFVVEPMVGKMVLPLLGGTPAVWNTCMVFFQAVLLAGYAYAHASTAWLGVRKQAVVHLALLLVPFFFVPLSIHHALTGTNLANPVPALLLLLLVSVGLPLFVVCTSAPLLQRWFSATGHPAAADPYFLYGASNLGSMLALLAYPTLIEPALTIRQQSLQWAVGYGLLAALTAGCAVLLWRSPPGSATEVEAEGAQDERGGEVTVGRRWRWVALAFVPSSLMLGVTAYITTDLAPIPLLWVLPLALYLLSFILVFARVPLRVQQTLVWLGLAGLLAAAVYSVSLFTERPSILWETRGLGIAGLGLSLLVFRLQGPNVLHRALTVVLPGLILVLLFLTVSPLRPWSAASLLGYLGVHLATLFVAAMVCHGELALDRPSTRHLTEYFLWLSVGGVLGGLFNALIAPLVFNGLVEYPLALVLTCLLLPAAATRERAWRRWVGLGLLLLSAGIGVWLMVLRSQDPEPPDVWTLLGGLRWMQRAALLLALGLGVFLTIRDRGQRIDRLLDLALPAALGVLVVGLTWGPSVREVADLVSRFHVRADEPAISLTLFLVVVFGLPALLCWSFAARPLRLALGVGALLMGYGLYDSVSSSVVAQRRSFFGVAKVCTGTWQVGSQIYPFRWLFHGTTLHGLQFTEGYLRYEPQTYFHPTGPIGHLFEAYDPHGRRNLGVLGLGTGTLAAYAHRGQHLTFYEIDPVIRAFSFDPGAYFTYVEDARRRGAHIDLVMGDARLTMAGQQLPPGEKYGIMIMDAFSSDSVPVHLLTREALRDVYLPQLREDGLLVFNISNRYLDLRPVLANLAQDAGLAGLYQLDFDESAIGKTTSAWVVLARKEKYLERLAHPAPTTTGIPRPAWHGLVPDPEVGVWTDDYAPLLRVIAWKSGGPFLGDVERSVTGGPNDAGSTPRAAAGSRGDPATSGPPS